MTPILVALVVVLIACAMPLAGYILLTQRTTNIHKMWDLAPQGHRLSRVCMAMVVASFLLAVAAWLLAFAEHRAARATAGASAWQSAHASGISDAITRQFQQQDGATVDLAVAAPGAWDRVCVLGPYANNRIARRLLGFDWDVEGRSAVPSSDSVSLLLFVHADKAVVFHVDHPRHHGDFSPLASRCFSRQEAVFTQVAQPTTGWPGLRPKSPPPHAAGSEGR